MSMVKYLEEQIAWRNKRINEYKKRILELDSFEIPNLLPLNRSDINHLIKQQEKLISHNQCIIEIYKNSIKDEIFNQIENTIKSNSNLKEIHSYLLFEAYLELKKFKDSKIDQEHYQDTKKALENSYHTILPYLEKSIEYSIPNHPNIVIKNLYERLRQLDYTKEEAKEVVNLLSPLDKERKQKPKSANEPLKVTTDPITGEKHINQIFIITQSIE